jgi:hypothetical protein
MRHRLALAYARCLPFRFLSRQMEASFEPSSNSNVTAYGSGLETAVRGR